MYLLKKHTRLYQHINLDISQNAFEIVKIFGMQRICQTTHKGGTKHIKRVFFNYKSRSVFFKLRTKL